MIDKIYKKIVRFLIDHRIAIIDFGSENEVDEFYSWLKSNKFQERKSGMMMKIIKIGAWAVGGFAVACLALMLICNQIVVNNAKGTAFSDIDSIKHNRVGLLLGTTPQARFDRITNYFFIYRIDAAEELYKAGKIEQILISGDENSLDGVNEPECMRDSLVARGIPSSAIFLDGKGYRTIESVVRTREVFGMGEFTIISQKFHNERAIYQAEHLGLNIEHIQAYNAKMPKSRRAFITTIREYFARVKMFLDLLTYKSAYPGCIKGSNLTRDTIYSFFGKAIVIDDSIKEQISKVAEQDTMLSYHNSILQIGNVKWKMYIDDRALELETTIQPNDSKMEEVVKHLNNTYGKPIKDEENDFYLWHSLSDDSLNINEQKRTRVSLCQSYSKKGGTCLSFKIGVDIIYCCGNALLLRKNNRREL